MSGSDNNLTESARRLETVERFAKALALVAVPVILGVLGFVVNSAITEKGLSRDYIEMALRILDEPRPPATADTSEVVEDSLMREWAVSLLQKRSPVDLPEGLAAALVRGSVSVPPRAADVADRAGARQAEREGFEAIRARDVDRAILAFQRSEALWPGYHWVFEIGKDLSARRQALSDPESAAWLEFLCKLIFEYSYGLPDEHAVAEAQRMLSLPVTGQANLATRDSVQAFQRRHSLQADGIPGTRTLQELWRQEHGATCRLTGE